MSTDGKRTDTKVIREFLAEAQEFIESLSRNLMDIDLQSKAGEPDPDMINEVFRGWHTLKGLASTFGVKSLSTVAHKEENLLDDIRLGRVNFEPDTLDKLFENVEKAMKILAAIEETGDITAGDKLMRDGSTIDPPEPTDIAGTPIKKTAEIDPTDFIGNEVLEVLTEFEEHRLKTNLKQGKALYKILSSFALQSIDTELEEKKKLLKPIGEIITYLPSAESADPDYLDIDILLSLHASYEALEEILEGSKVDIQLLVPAQNFRPETHSTVIPPPFRAPKEEVVASTQDIVETQQPPIPVQGPAMIAGAERVSLVPQKRDQPLSLRSVSQSVRVDIGKLDKLMNVVGELNIIRSSIAKVSSDIRSTGRRDLAIELHRVSRGFERRLTEMREGILEVRMVPVSQMFDRLARISRKISRKLDKEINLVVSGSSTEVDKLIIEELSDPLMHIVRNAIDHGIEDKSTRLAAGKPEIGTVAITAYNKGNHILIEVEDDGRGIDPEKLVSVAIARGLVSEEQAAMLSDREKIEILFLPGITTTKETSEVSGRGVGMDVVKTNISSLGGIVEVQSEIDIGTKFTITMPVTLAITPALLVNVDDNTYAIPLNTVAEVLMISAQDVQMVMGYETMTLRGATLPLCRLDSFFGRPRTGPILDDSRVIIASIGQRRLGVVVDTLIGQQEVVIKPLGKSLINARCFAGATDVGEQKLSLVVDTASIVEEFFATGEDAQWKAVISE